MIVTAFRLYDIKNKQTLCYHYIYMFIIEAAGINTFKYASAILAHTVS